MRCRCRSDANSVDPGAFAGFGIAVDGITLVDTLTRLFQRGLFAKVPTLATCAWAAA